MYCFKRTNYRFLPGIQDAKNAGIEISFYEKVYQKTVRGGLTYSTPRFQTQNINLCLGSAGFDYIIPRLDFRPQISFSAQDLQALIILFCTQISGSKYNSMPRIYRLRLYYSAPRFEAPNIIPCLESIGFDYIILHLDFRLQL